MVSDAEDGTGGTRAGPKQLTYYIFYGNLPRLPACQASGSGEFAEGVNGLCPIIALQVKYIGLAKRPELISFDAFPVPVLRKQQILDMAAVIFELLN